MNRKAGDGRAHAQVGRSDTIRATHINRSIVGLLTQAADAAGVKLILGFQRRFDGNFQAVKRQVEAGAIGGIRTFRIVSRDPAPPPAEYLKTSGA